MCEATSHLGVTSVDGTEVGQVCDECFIVKPCPCQDGQI